MESMAGTFLQGDLLPVALKRQHAGLLRPATDPDSLWANKNSRKNGGPYMWWMYHIPEGETESPHLRALDRLTARVIPVSKEEV